MMRVRVDMGLCEANGVCMGIIPEVFDLDEGDKLTIVNPRVTADNAEQIHDAVRQCPRQALVIEG